jgi:hypothetical protein
VVLAYCLVGTSYTLPSQKSHYLDESINLLAFFSFRTFIFPEAFYLTNNRFFHEYHYNIHCGNNELPPKLNHMTHKEEELDESASTAPHEPSRAARKDPMLAIGNDVQWSSCAPPRIHSDHTPHTHHPFVFQTNLVNLTHFFSQSVIHTDGWSAFVGQTIFILKFISTTR